MVLSDAPILNDINNGNLTSKNAMPQKDSTSDGTADFSKNRRTFWRFLGNPLQNVSTLNLTTRSAHDIDGQPRLVQLGANVNQKKWGNTNRDASQIVSRNRVLSVGQGSFNASGTPLSFTTTRSINTERDARNRCRSGGYCVPKKVTQKNVIPSPLPKYFHIVAAGNNSLASHGSPLPSHGFYSYLSGDISGFGNMKHAGGRSYNLVVLSRYTGEIISHTTYDVFGNLPDHSDGIVHATTMANALNALDSSVMTIIFTFDEPKTNATVLQTAMRRCGASSNFPGNVNYRGAYILLGIPGINANGGLEYYRGSSTLNDVGDVNAWIDLKFSVKNGEYVYISG